MKIQIWKVPSCGVLLLSICYCFGGHARMPDRPGSDHIGSVSMNVDRTIVLTLEEETADGETIRMQSEHHPGQPMYEDILRMIGDIKPGEERFLPRTIGVVVMKADKRIVLTLRAETEQGLVGDAQFEHFPGDPMYEKVLEHVGGLEPGEEKFVPPWPDE